jgi:hypothetical protein
MWLRRRAEMRKMAEEQAAWAATQPQDWDGPLDKWWPNQEPAQPPPGTRRDTPVEAVVTEEPAVEESVPTIDVASELVRVVEVVSTMCDHLIDYIETDRAERRAMLEADRAERLLMIEALTKLVRSIPGAAGLPALEEGADAQFAERIVGGSMDAGPEPEADTIIDLRELGTVGEVRCRLGDRWVDGFEICGVSDDELGLRYRVRRRTDGIVLPDLVDAADIQYVEPYDDFTGPPAQQSNWSPL